MAAHDLWAFTEYSGHIRLIDELLENLFASLNNRVGTFVHYRRGIDEKQHDEQARAEFKQQEAKFRERFGWDE